jgi:hypothetical protein
VYKTAAVLNPLKRKPTSAGSVGFAVASGCPVGVFCLSGRDTDINEEFSKFLINSTSNWTIRDIF